MDTSDIDANKFGPVTGVLASVLIPLGAIIALKDSPDFPGAPEEWATYVNAHDDRLVVGAVIGMTGVFFLLWFIATLTEILGRAEAGLGRLTSFARGGGVAGSALLLTGFACALITGIRIDDQGPVTADYAVVLNDLFAALCDLAAPYALAALLLGSGLVIIRTGVLMRWLGWVAAVIAVGLLVPFIAFAFMLAFVLWVLVVSVILIVQGERESTTRHRVTETST